MKSTDLALETLRQFGLTVLVLVAFVGIMCTLAHSQQPHIHGVQGIPDWYDVKCCDVRDCRPVEDKEIEFFARGGSDWIRHVPTDVIFQRSQWRISQDERYHVCIHNDGTGLKDDLHIRGLCVYIRPGA